MISAAVYVAGMRAKSEMTMAIISGYGNSLEPAPEAPKGDIEEQTRNNPVLVGEPEPTAPANN